MTRITGQHVVNILKEFSDPIQEDIRAIRTNISVGRTTNERTLQGELRSLILNRLRSENADRCGFNVEIETAGDGPSYNDLKITILETKFTEEVFKAEVILLAWIEIKFYYNKPHSESRINEVTADIDKAKQETSLGGIPVMIVCTHENRTWQDELDQLSQDGLELIHIKVE